MVQIAEFLRIERKPLWVKREKMVVVYTSFFYISYIVRRTAYFRLSPLLKHVRKVVGGFEKKSCVSTGVRKPGNTYASPTAMI